MSTAHLGALRNDIDSDFKRSLLSSIALFRDVDPDAIADLLPRCGRLDVSEGQVLLTPEQPNECVYVVLSGRLEVRIGALNAPKIADLTIGSCAGEMSLIEDKDPSAYVVAAEETHLMVLSPGLLWQLVERSHAFAKNLLVVLSERVRFDNQFIANSIGVLRKAEHDAITDALTGLNNRHWMHDTFARELRQAQRDGTKLCLMMIDVDQFKSFNDEYGHIAGDAVLAAVADTLRSHVRPSDLLARFGGDEFAVLLPNLELAQAEATAERLREALLALRAGGLPAPITISIGVTSATLHDDLNKLVHRADAAMYEAKAQGRNCVRLKEPPNAPV